MEKYRCKLCFKSFINGRALGGHIRSHKIQQPSESLSQFTESASSSSSSEEEQEQEEENEEEEELLCHVPKKSIPLVDPEFHPTSMVLQDRESETESSQNPTRRRSKRIRNWDIKIPHIPSSKEVYKSESEPASSISDTTPDEDVAYCLMMLSRDKWKKKKKEKDDMDSNESFDFDFDFGYKFKKQRKIQGKYKCETCERVFKSYQALGGHRASHKKMKVKVKQSEFFPPLMAETEKIHECPVCFRVFGSGQALGGHKRSHIASSLSASALSDRQMSSKNVGKLIDLNLPAPVDDDEISQVEVSVVSNGEFGK